MKNPDWPVSERPREKLLARGPAALSDAELLAIFLGTGTRDIPVMQLAGELLQKFRGVRGLLEADQAQLVSAKGMGVAKSAQLRAALELTERYLQAGFDRGDPLTDPVTTGRFLKSKLRGYTREVFACLYLGTIDGASVHPREVVKRVLFHNAAAVIFAHNHPSGVAEPSQADQRITDRLKSALLLVDVRVLDHLIVGDEQVTSFAKRGLL
jgi:DNA repair protein RadC